MQTSPNTDRTFGIASAEKFREVRDRSKREETERKSRRDRKEDFHPRFNIDDQVVITQIMWRQQNKHYQLVQIVDVENFQGYRGVFTYYGIVLKVTDPNRIPRLGHLIKFSEEQRGWGFEGWTYANVKDDGTIKWAAVKEE